MSFLLSNTRENVHRLHIISSQLVQILSLSPSHAAHIVICVRLNHQFASNFSHALYLRALCISSNDYQSASDRTFMYTDSGIREDVEHAAIAFLSLSEKVC